MLNCLVKKLKTKMDVTTMKRRIQGSFYLGRTAVIFMFMYICIWD